MKLQSTPLLENLTSSELNALARQVKETVAPNCPKNKKRIFSAADFWDLQRRKRNLQTKRFVF